MTHDELLERIKDPIELSRWLDKGVADKEVTLSQAQIYWHNTNALRAIVELHKPYYNEGLTVGHCKGCQTTLDNITRHVSYPCPTIQAIEGELG